MNKVKRFKVKDLIKSLSDESIQDYECLFLIDGQQEFELSDFYCYKDKMEQLLFTLFQRPQ